jgi:nucleotide-binding universal stress UspA family protein
MKIMATFDGSAFAESTLPLLERMARLPDAEFVLLSVAQEAHGQRARDRVRRPTVATLGGAGGGGSAFVIQPTPERYAEVKGQAMQRYLDDGAAYLHDLVKRLPSGPTYTVETHISHDAAATIVERSLVEEPDVIVMATHGRTGLAHLLFGSVAEQVVHSGVAPVLLVHPGEVVRARVAGRTTKDETPRPGVSDRGAQDEVVTIPPGEANPAIIRLNVSCRRRHGAVVDRASR